MIKIADLKFSEYNPRTMTEKEVKDLKESLKRFGFVEPIVVNKAPERFNVIIGGHQRVRVAKEFLKIEEVPVVYVEIPDLEKEQELNLRLNKNVGRWDWDLLANFDNVLLKDVGFTSEEMDNIFNLNLPNEKDDVIPENVPPIAKLGDVWQLGRHFVMCGDSTKKEDVEKLMDGKKADMVFTDPPYNIGFSDPKNLPLWYEIMKVRDIGWAVEKNLIKDIFLGNGTTLIACEKTNRICYGCEIDPKYVDVIIKRWEDYMGQKAELLS